MTKRPFVLLLASALALLGTARLTAATDSAAQVERPALFIVEARADWCGHCKAVGAELTKIREPMLEKPVVFFDLDMTSPATRANSLKLARLLGLHQALKDVNERTQVILVDGESGDVLKAIKGRQSAETYAAAIENHLEASPTKKTALR